MVVAERAVGMDEKSKTKKQLISEIAALRQQNEALEEALALLGGDKKSTEKYRLLIENSHDIIYTLNPQGVFTFVSSSWTSLLGHSVSDVVGKPFHKFVHPDDVETCSFFLRTVIETNQRQAGVDYRVQHVDGSWRWHTSNGAPLKDESGIVISYQGIARDITARKQAEEALKESQQKLADIIDFLPDATFVIDKEEKVIAWNRAMEEMTGINAADMLGKDNYEYSLVFYGERRPLLIDLVLQPDEDIEKRYTRKNKKEMFLEAETYISSFKGKEAYLFGKANILSDLNGNVVGAIESVRDITAARQAQKSLKFSEERFSKAFNLSPAPTTISTIDEGRFVDVNDSYLRMIGYTREEMIGRTTAELSVWFDLEHRRSLTRKLLDQGSFRGEAIHCRTKTGERRKLLMSAEIIGLKGKKFILAIFYDITEQEKLEVQLRQSQRMEAIGTLAGGIAHDFNNILGAVMGYTEMALGRSPVDDHLQRYLQHIFKASERARDLVKQILTFSRKSDEKLLPLRVSPIIKEVLKLLRATLPSTIKISENIDSNPDTVLADPTQIHQILMNLCTNAAYAIPEKKGEIKISLASEQIESDISSGLDSGMYLKLTVSDTGIGMDSSTLGRIFDPFFTTKKPGEGTGLGLSVVYGIVKSYGGTITVQSEAGKGSEFCVYLPLFTKAENNEEKPKEAAAGGKERILFVDDEEPLVELGENLLASLGYDVVGKKNSLEALDLFSSCPEKFDLVVTDLTMPDMTGIDLAQKILRIKPGMPIILCTGFSETITPESIDSVGVKDLIMKPFQRRQIAESIRKTLDKKE